MKEIKKITFYGKDFSKIEKAKYSLGGSKKAEVDKKYLALLKAFCASYETVGLLFPKNPALFNKYVGVFRKKKFSFYYEIDNVTEIYDVTLEISCRFDKSDKDESDKAFFLMAMLLCLTDKELHFIENEAVNITFHQVMDIFLLFMFKYQLSDAAKKGIFRRYQRFENNDSRPHGTIDIARHIRENMGLNNGKIAYHYRELTANNPVNRLILAAYKRLGEKYPTLCEGRIDQDERVYSTLNMLQTELGWSKTNLRSIVKENLRPVTHPYFSEYEALRRTCLKILRDEGVSIFDAESSEETEALYVDVTWLWEQFLESRLRKQIKQREDLGLLLKTQGDNQRGRQIFAERKSKSARPDFVLWQGQEARAILDAKFKPHWNDFFCESTSEEGGTDTSIDDDISKCIRDMVVFQTRRTGVVFPFREEEKDRGKGLYHQAYHIGAAGDAAPGFDMVRVPVPRVGGKSFHSWHQVLEEAVNQTLKDYLEKMPRVEAAPQRPASDEAKL